MITKVKYIILSFLLLAIIGILWNHFVGYFTNDQLYSVLDEIPPNRVGLLLGTSHKVKGGYVNLYYKHRINSAVKLYKSGKVKKIICSGDNGTKYYNEPVQMQKDLMRNGVKEEDIYLDYAGFRTLDSVVRAKEIFGQNRITIISQKFHNERAVFIARYKGIDAIAFNAEEVKNSSRWKIMLREKIARAKMALDLILNKQPKFLGSPVVIP
jgi:SanA protein